MYKILCTDNFNVNIFEHVHIMGCNLMIVPQTVCNEWLRAQRSTADTSIFQTSHYWNISATWIHPDEPEFTDKKKLVLVKTLYVCKCLQSNGKRKKWSFRLPKICSANEVHLVDCGWFVVMCTGHLQIFFHLWTFYFTTGLPFCWR